MIPLPFFQNGSQKSKIQDPFSSFSLRPLSLSPHFQRTCYIQGSRDMVEVTDFFWFSPCRFCRTSNAHFVFRRNSGLPRGKVGAPPRAVLLRSYSGSPPPHSPSKNKKEGSAGERAPHLGFYPTGMWIVFSCRLHFRVPSE